MRILVRNNGESLRHLRLREFVTYETEGQDTILSLAQNLPTLSDLLNLETLDIDYSWMFASMFSPKAFQNLKNCKTPALRKILLTCDFAIRDALYRAERRGGFTGLKSSDWLFLKTLLPNLEVELVMEALILTERNLEFLITSNMPISKLEYSDWNLESGKVLQSSSSVPDHQ